MTECADIVKENCYDSYNYSLKKYCYLDVDTCKEYASCKDIGTDGTDCKDKSGYRCDVKNGECSELTADAEDVKACSDRTENEC